MIIDSLNIKIGLSVSDETAAAAAAILGLWFEEHPEKTIISRLEVVGDRYVTRIKIDDMPEDIKP